jgi:hypothetical protein
MNANGGNGDGRNLPAPIDPDDRLPWEKRPDETPEAYEGWLHYRDSPTSERSIRNTAHELAKDRTLIGRWSAQHEWVTRLDLYELHLDRQARLAREEAKAEMIKRHAAVTAAASVAALARLRGRRASEDGSVTAVAPLDPSQLDAGEVASLMRVAIWGERLTYGEPTDLVKGARAVTLEEAQRVLGQIMEIALNRIPEEQHALFIAEVKALGGLH